MNATLRLWDGYNHTSPELREAVAELQEKLNNHGFTTSADGFFGPDTEVLVERFQRANGLTDDGIVGPKTWAALDGVDAPQVELYETVLGNHDSDMHKQNEIAKNYSDYIRYAAQEAGVHQSIICGIGSRESRWGLALTPPFPYGTGDFAHRSSRKEFRQGSLPPDGKGFGRGIMQIDYDAHDFARKGEWRDPGKNIAYSGKVLGDNIKLLAKRMPGLKSMDLLRASIAAYNCGAGNVMKAINACRSVDFYTAHRDYSRDALSRAGWFQRNGW